MSTNTVQPIFTHNRSHHRHYVLLERISCRKYRNYVLRKMLSMLKKRSLAQELNVSTPYQKVMTDLAVIYNLPICSHKVYGEGKQKEQRPVDAILTKLVKKCLCLSSEASLSPQLEMLKHAHAPCLL